jgi:hypothetical protein
MEDLIQRLSAEMEIPTQDVERLLVKILGSWIRDLRSRGCGGRSERRSCKEDHTRGATRPRPHEAPHHSRRSLRAASGCRQNL